MTRKNGMTSGLKMDFNFQSSERNEKVIYLSRFLKLGWLYLKKFNLKIISSKILSCRLIVLNAYLKLAIFFRHNFKLNIVSQLVETALALCVFVFEHTFLSL